ncbi:PLP-dependent aminotransferase family protein [Streptomyces sp. SID13666]|uniref:aminotransferase-like domain-containing protein n=1 Tax=unclassified Streptomyces TaxID=2593676 RepID=UPI0013BEEA53|nr:MULTISPECIES: PLP-dependent aminotransferase family protein [unclassified Streptomyces]NEA56022.1 PLP-dependent aminotransferase family protein [Streptomyces sp. SID13666]NEA71997.1 PLP-dependent aminotransferase family protein [Streptomyces sp. SID13588]
MNDGSSSHSLADSLRGELERFSPGAKLPSSRSLVDRFGVSPVTVSRALAALAAEGLVETRPGSGTYRSQPAAHPAGPVDTSWQQVALTAGDQHGEPAPRVVDASGVLATLAAPPPGVIPLNGGYLHPDLQPQQALGAALARAARRPGAWDRPPVEGLTALRTWFAREAGVGPAQVLITAGGQAALTTALRALAPPGSALLVESPTYPGVLAVARAAGLRPVPVPTDADGVRPDLLADAFDATGARVFFCQPLFQNPTGTVLAPARRAQITGIARAAGAFVIEDDFARRLGHGGPLPAPLVADDPHGTVVHVTSLTKPTSPSLRVGALIARGPVVERLRAIQVVDSFFVPRPLQEATLELVGAPAWPRHLRAVATGLRERRDAMLAALRRDLPELVPDRVPSGGYQLWLRLPDGTDETELCTAALRASVAVAAGRAYFAAEAPAPYIRVSFADTSGTEEIDEGIRRLAAAFTEVRAGI